MFKVAIIGTTLLLVSTHVFAAAPSDKAVSILKKLATTLESARTISVNAVATADEIEPVDDFKVQKTFAMEVRFQRPDKLFATKTGDENQRAYYNGKSLTVVDPLQKKFAEENIVGTVDDLVVKLGQMNIDAPLADLFLSNLSELAEKSVQKARYLGVSRIGIEDCEHVIFRTAVADWQLWVSQGQSPTICKSLITTRGLAQAPQYEVTFSDWKFNAEIPDTTFAPQIPEGASQVPLAPSNFRKML
jgi:hypothetical protein